MALNAWMVSGRLTRAPWVADSDKVLKLTIASNKGYSQEAIKKAQEQSAQKDIPETLFPLCQKAFIGAMIDALITADRATKLAAENEE